MDINTDLRQICHINKNEDGDNFVGIKADSQNIKVHFPIGYQLPEIEEDIKNDIFHLISILEEFAYVSEKTLVKPKFGENKLVAFPIQSYMEVITDYLNEKKYYVEKEIIYKTSDRSANSSWSRTIRNQNPLIQSNGSFIFNRFTARKYSPNENKAITQIHRYCVYESFKKLGWLYVNLELEKYDMEIDIESSIRILHKKLANTNNDKNKRLFMSMISILEYKDVETSERQFFFGTSNFEYIWEKLVDRVYGIKNKQEYFPKTKWQIKKGKIKSNRALEPDTIMIVNNKIYVLDAKYYRYGITGEPKHLPNSSSINKQITYGEFISKQRHLKDKYGENMTIYNAFIMPYNSSHNLFGFNSRYGNIGEATADWKENEYYYERVQGIVVDTRYLMYHYTENSESRRLELAKYIEETFNHENNRLVKASNP